MADLTRTLQVRIGVDPGPEVSGLVATHLYRRRLWEIQESELYPEDLRKLKAANRAVLMRGSTYEEVFAVAFAERVIQTDLDNLKKRLAELLDFALSLHPVHGVEVAIDATGLGRFAADELRKVALEYMCIHRLFEITATGSVLANARGGVMPQNEMLPEG